MLSVSVVLTWPSLKGLGRRVTRYSGQIINCWLGIRLGVLVGTVHFFIQMNTTFVSELNECKNEAIPNSLPAYRPPLVSRSPTPVAITL
jgi:hypothetical protein